MHAKAHKISDRSPAGDTGRIRDEFRMLLLCARTRVDPQQQAQIQTLARGQLDWEFVLGKAYWHSLAPMLYRNLSKVCADLVPPEIMARFESEYMGVAKRNLVLTAELIKVLRILESGGITAVPYKGPTLAALAYGDVALRKFCDLDVVIRPCDIIETKSLLVSHGYQWRPFKGQVTGASEARNFHFWNEYSFIHPDNNATIDLHWRISPRRFPFDIDLDELWKHLETAQLLGHHIHVFPAEYLLLFLCVHGTKDLWWKRIGWICDIAEQLSSNPDIDWQRCLELATRTGTRRTLLLGPALARELLGTPLPDPVCDWIRTDSTVQKLVEYVCHRMFDEESMRDRILEKQRFRIRARERFRDRIPVYRHLVSAPLIKLFVPSRKDIELIELPGAPFALYYLVRPFRLAKRLWSRALHGNDTPTG